LARSNNPRHCLDESLAVVVEPPPARRVAGSAEFLAGVHTGEVRTIDRKVGGLGVGIGARVGALAGASEFLVSQTVKDLVVGSGLEFEDAGEHELKGFPNRWRLYRVVAS
jgi:class 3 adenylate cyclase